MDQNVRDILCNVKEKMQEYFFLKDETYDQTTIDNKTNELTTQINNKSKVTFSRTLSSGTKIGKITIDGVGTDIFCEKDTNTVYQHPNSHSTDMIKDPKEHNNIGSTANETQSSINTKIDTKLNEKSPIVTFTNTLISGTDTKELGRIKIGNTEKILYCDKNTNTTYQPSNITPKAPTADGSIGTSNQYARADHQHKIDTSRAAKEHTHNYSKVAFNRALNNGTKIGSINIDGTNTDIYCETNTDTTYNIADVNNPGLMSKEAFRLLSDLDQNNREITRKTLHSKIHLYKFNSIVSMHFNNWNFGNTFPKDGQYHEISSIQVPTAYRPIYDIYIRDVVQDGHIVIGSDGKIWALMASESSGIFNTQASWMTNPGIINED